MCAQTRSYFFAGRTASPTPSWGRAVPPMCAFYSLALCSAHQDGHVEGSSHLQGKEEAGEEVLRESQGEVSRAGARQLRHVEWHGADWQRDRHSCHLESRLQGHGREEKEFEVSRGT